MPGRGVGYVLHRDKGAGGPLARWERPAVTAPGSVERGNEEKQSWLLIC